MTEFDYDEFSTLLDDAYDLIGSGANRIISDRAKAMFFRSVSRYPIEVFRAALDAHLTGKDGHFCPKPAHINAQIEGMAGDDGRPGAEEAWAIALTAEDETDTVVWTAEIAEAFALCRPVLARGDEVGARMSFKEAYLRSVVTARAARRPVQWSACLGWDQAKRSVALEKAVRSGLLPAPAVAGLLPAPIGEPLPDAHARIQITKVLSMLAFVNAELDAEANRKIEAAWDAEQEITQAIADQVAGFTCAEVDAAYDDLQRTTQKRHLLVQAAVAKMKMGA